MAHLTRLPGRIALSLSLALSLAIGLTFVATRGIAESTNAAPKPVRLAIVNTPKMSGLIDKLAADFESKHGIKIEIYSGSDVYEHARSGQTDLVISHYGKAGAEPFVLEGFGLWPKTVFSNQLVVVGPKSDPAGIKGMTNASEAFARIASTRSPFAVNALHGIAYISDLFWQEAGSPPKGDWYLDPGVAKGQAMKFAEEKQAYTVWGALPFMRFKEKHASGLEIMVSKDPSLQRVMVAIVVNPQKVPTANREGAEAFTNFLLTPETQAMIAAFRSAGSDLQFWWPAGRHNSTEGAEE